MSQTVILDHIFSILLLALGISIAVSIYVGFAKHTTRKQLYICIGVSLSIFVAMISIVFQNAYALPSLDKADVEQSAIYQKIALIIAIGLQIAILGVITAMFMYLWYRAKRYPKNGYIILHKLLVAIGIAAILTYIGYTIRNFIVAPNIEILPEMIYVAVFPGSIFWMLLCSIVAAIGIPETNEVKSLQQKINKQL